jgi:nitronate monooxygenase
VRLLESLGVDLPVVQAGMGGGIARYQLAAAVSEAGGLGTIGLLHPPAMRAELAAARDATGKPVAVNLLLPFARRGHWEVAREADALVTFWGPPRRRTAGVWLHQCGSVEEAGDAHAAGADAVIVQGVEAGGHVRGVQRALDLLERTQAALPDGYPLLLAGGIADAADVGRALEAGAEAAVLGTRFVLSEESAPIPRTSGVGWSRATLLTELFGAGWPAPHRVLPNAATRRWLRDDPRGPAWLRRLHHATAPVLGRTPQLLQMRMAALARPSQPLLAPQPPIAGGPDSLVEAGPLYAGETVARIDQVRAAGVLTGEVVP